MTMYGELYTWHQVQSHTMIVKAGKETGGCCSLYPDEAAGMSHTFLLRYLRFCTFAAPSSVGSSCLCCQTDAAISSSVLLQENANT